jgi:hypothetical protein
MWAAQQDANKIICALSNKSNERAETAKGDDLPTQGKVTVHK